MKTGFACPTCQVPLVLKFVAAKADAAMRGTSGAKCPNPFCRAELPPRRADMTLVYALVGTITEDDGEPMTVPEVSARGAVSARR